uniref:Secreted peptide n=1 Tax=Rhipicephalus pulchellus TaxID=72859 RepID=L7LXH1_RHIPC
MPASVIHLWNRGSCCLLVRPWCCRADCCGLTDSSVLPHIRQCFKCSFHYRARVVPQALEPREIKCKHVCSLGEKGKWTPFFGCCSWSLSGPGL